MVHGPEPRLHYLEPPLEPLWYRMFIRLLDSYQLLHMHLQQ